MVRPGHRTKAERGVAVRRLAIVHEGFIGGVQRTVSGSASSAGTPAKALDTAQARPARKTARRLSGSQRPIGCAACDFPAPITALAVSSEVTTGAGKPTDNRAREPGLDLRMGPVAYTEL